LSRLNVKINKSCWRLPQRDSRARLMLWYIIVIITKKPAMNPGMKNLVWYVKSMINATVLGTTKAQSFVIL
jgi:hypothetical protein